MTLRYNHFLRDRSVCPACGAGWPQDLDIYNFAERGGFVVGSPDQPGLEEDRFSGCIKYMVGLDIDLLFIIGIGRRGLGVSGGRRELGVPGLCGERGCAKYAAYEQGDEVYYFHTL